jgi:hypothetical protein
VPDTGDSEVTEDGDISSEQSALAIDPSNDAHSGYPNGCERIATIIGAANNDAG